MIRLNKFLSEAGVCSRREADKLIEQGTIKVNGKRATLGMQVDETMEVKVGKKVISEGAEKIVLAFNKPSGIVCTENRRDRNNIIKYIGYPKRITYAGRLDKESEGLMIMTNDGDLIQHMMRAVNGHEKEYKVTVDKEITKEFLSSMSKGVHIVDEEKKIDAVTRTSKVTQIGKYTFSIILTQGLNRQIRRMCEALGYNVRKLLRIRIMNIKLGNLPIGKYRELTKEELDGLYGDERENEGASLPFK
ncbi:MAG: pseudouridine synthase [Suipraeoptans sp.]